MDSRGWGLALESSSPPSDLNHPFRHKLNSNSNNQMFHGLEFPVNLHRRTESDHQMEEVDDENHNNNNKEVDFFSDHNNKKSNNNNSPVHRSSLSAAPHLINHRVKEEASSRDHHQSAAVDHPTSLLDNVNVSFTSLFFFFIYF